MGSDSKCSLNVMVINILALARPCPKELRIMHKRVQKRVIDRGKKRGRERERGKIERIFFYLNNAKIF